MCKIDAITPVFVGEVPEALISGVLYISEMHEVAVHPCACGCGVKTVTSLITHDWSLIKHEDGTVPLDPSIGNFKCEKPYHAHYYIRHNKIVWC